MLVLAVGDNAAIGKIAKGLEQGNNVSAPLNEKLSKLSKSISIFLRYLVFSSFIIIYKKRGQTPIRHPRSEADQSPKTPD